MDKLDWKDDGCSSYCVTQQKRLISGKQRKDLNPFQEMELETTFVKSFQGGHICVHNYTAIVRLLKLKVESQLTSPSSIHR